VSTKEGAEILRNKGKGQSAEVTPHHLFLTIESEFESEAYGKVNPPLRTKSDRDALWEALKDGRIDMISSDHAPHTIDEKEEFETAPSGVPGVETALPLILGAVKKGLLSFERAVNILIESPAERFYPQKGSIEVGKDGDLIIIDMRDVRKIKGDELHSRAGWTPFEGMDAIFPVDVYLRGKRIIKNGDFEGEMGFGKNLWMNPSTAHHF
jgi:dihydroorotase